MHHYNPIPPIPAPVSSATEKINPICQAVLECNTSELSKLLEEQIETASKGKVYPRDFKYRFMDLLEKDTEGRTALHFAAAVTNEEISLETIKILLNSKQARVMETVNKEALNRETKLTKIVNCPDGNQEIGIIRAIENKSPKVISYLLNNRSNMVAKNIKGTDVLKLIYENVPDALETYCDSSIELHPDRTSFSIDWTSLIGFRKIDGMTSWTDTEYLSSTLTHTNDDDAVAKIIVHPLTKLFLDIKWKKIRLIFVASFVFHDEKEFSALGIPARIAAMGTGELEARDMLEKALNGSATFRDFVCVLCFLLFTVFVVTLHFNLLIGYAVSDIQTLNKEAKELELYNRLSTIFTIESFLVTTAQFFPCPRTLKKLYVLPPLEFKHNKGIENLEFTRIPVELRKELQDIAFRNLNEAKKNEAKKKLNYFFDLKE